MQDLLHTVSASENGRVAAVVGGTANVGFREFENLLRMAAMGSQAAAGGHRCLSQVGRMSTSPTNRSESHHLIIRPEAGLPGYDIVDHSPVININLGIVRRIDGFCGDALKQQPDSFVV